MNTVNQRRRWKAKRRRRTLLLVARALGVSTKRAEQILINNRKTYWVSPLADAFVNGILLPMMRKVEADMAKALGIPSNLMIDRP